MKYLLFLSSGIIAVLGLAFVVPQKYDSYFSSNKIKFGTTAFPSSLDSLTNPSATDSVATVSHSAQHANANDSIEAIEAKLGTSASTAVNNSILTGNGSGSSIWTTYATTSSIYSTIMSAITASSTNLIAYGSSTFQNFTAKQATTSQATTTNLAISTLSDQIPYANSNGSILPVTIGTNMSFTGGILSSSLSSYYFGATSSIPTMPGFGSSAQLNAATTTSISLGESMMIWFKSEGANAQAYLLNVKAPGLSTTTLDYSRCPNTATPCMFTLMGMYTASTSAAAGNIEIYVSTANYPYNYASLILPGFIYIRFTN